MILLLIKDSISELVIMGSRPVKMNGSTTANDNKRHYAYVPLEMLHAMMKRNPMKNSIQAQSYIIPGQDPNGRKERPKCSNYGREGHTSKTVLLKGGGKEGQWPARNLNDVKCFRCIKNGHYARDCKEDAPSAQNPASQQQQVKIPNRMKTTLTFSLDQLLRKV